jgi:hypothetical protein
MGASSAMRGVQDDDPTARALARVAYEGLYRWPFRVGGHVVAFELWAAGCVFSGQVRALRHLGVLITGPGDPRVVGAVRELLATQLEHLAGAEFETTHAGGRFGFEEGPEPLHPRGRRVLLHGHGGGPSWYRIRDGRFHQIARSLRGRGWREHCVEAWLDLDDGRHLPLVSALMDFGDGGSLLQAELVAGDFEACDGVWLPRCRARTGATPRGMETWTIHLHGHDVVEGAMG